MPKIGRNERCPCGSGRKYKKCCLWKDSADSEKIEAAVQQYHRDALAFTRDTTVEDIWAMRVPVLSCKEVESE